MVLGAGYWCFERAYVCALQGACVLWLESGDWRARGTEFGFRDAVKVFYNLLRALLKQYISS
ncbi:hypothetical protein BH80429_12950 [Bartonella henselae]|nr:hypothetical protein BH623125_05010 [Bartonella henselae]GFF04474.1 hypothetical protein BH80429_12950 [Bartonella henselae]